MHLSFIDIGLNSKKALLLTFGVRNFPERGFLSQNPRFTISGGEVLSHVQLWGDNFDAVKGNSS